MGPYSEAELAVCVNVVRQFIKDNNLGRKAKFGTAWINPMSHDVNLCNANAYRASLWM